LSFCLNDDVDGSYFSSVDSLFQVYGAATQKALVPLGRWNARLSERYQIDIVVHA